MAVERSPDVRSAIWIKGIAFNALAGAQCASQRPSGGILQDPETGALFDGLVREGAALAAAVGAHVPAGQVEKLRAVLADCPPTHTVSLYDDLVAGRPLELETTIGALLTLGERLGVPRPATRQAYEAIRPFAAGSG